MPGHSKAVKQSKPSQTPPRSGHPDTPPNSPTQTLSTFTLTEGQFQQLLDTVTQAAEGASDSRPASGAGPSTDKDDEKRTE